MTRWARGVSLDAGIVVTVLTSALGLAAFGEVAWAGGLLLTAAAGYAASSLITVRSRKRRAKSRKSRSPELYVRRCLQLAAQARWLHRGLDAFVAEALLSLPRQPGGVFSRRHRRRLRAWEAATTSRYHVEFRAWAVEVYVKAVELGAVSRIGPHAVEGRSAAQIRMLPEFFADIARVLEDLAGDAR